MLVAVLVPHRSVPAARCCDVQYQIITVSVDLESMRHMWSRSFCQGLSKHFGSDELFLLEQARRLKSQKACYGGILYGLPHPPTPSLFNAGEHSTALPDDSVCNVTRDSHLLQPSYDPVPLPLYCWGLLKGFYFSLISHLRQLTSSSCCFLLQTDN